MVYYQGSDGIAFPEKSASYEIKLQPDDLLMIIVSTDDPEIAEPFNLKSISIQSPGKLDAASKQQTMQLYLTDANGFVEFPVLGKLKVSGMTALK